MKASILKGRMTSSQQASTIRRLYTKTYSYKNPQHIAEGCEEPLLRSVLVYKKIKHQREKLMLIQLS